MCVFFRFGMKRRNGKNMDFESLQPDTVNKPPCFCLPRLSWPANGGRIRDEATAQMMNLPSGLDPFRLNASSGPEPGLGI